MPPEPDETHANALPAGTRIDRYRIDSILGHGGFGITYLGLDESLLRKVAIKECLPIDICARTCAATVAPLSGNRRTDFEWALKRFVEEAQILARFEHPHIVRVSDVFQANGTAYMVMRFLEGVSLEQWLRHRPGPPDEPVLRRILLALLDALDVVHGQGVLHRDIKPENIQIGPDGTPTLLDFGSARHAVTNRSRPVTSVVSPGYAPFEQYYDGGTQGAWTDLYALGAVFHRAITGKPPPEATRRERHDPYEPLAVSHRGRYSEPFLALIDRMLRQDEKARPQTVGDVRTLLNQPDADAPPVGGHASPAPMPKPVRPFHHWMRAPVAKFALGVLLLVGVIGAGLALWQPWGSTSSPSLDSRDGQSALAGGETIPPQPSPNPPITEPGTPTPAPPEITPAPRPQPAKWTITSNPRGAAIFLDGNPTGRRTPHTLELADFSRRHRIDIDLKGYRKRPTQEELPEPDRERTFDFGNLIPVPKIRLTITNDEITDLNQLAISINGDARRRPAIERRSLVLAGDWLADGRHRLTLTCVGYKDFETEILVNEQTPQPERNIAFEPLPALLTLVWSGPSDCELFIDGTKYGRGTHRSGVKIPLDHRKSHVLSAKAEGFVFTRSQAVSLKTPGEEKTQELFFEKIPPPVPPRPPIPETFTIRFVAGSQRAPEKVRLTIESLDGRKLYDRYHYTIDQPLDFPWGKGTYRLHISANGYKLIRSDRFEISDNGMPIRLPFVQDTGAPW